MFKGLSKAYIALGIVCFFWGTTYLATGVAVQTIHGIFLAGIRQTIAGMLIAGYFLLRGSPFPRGPELKRLIWTGILMVGISNGFMNWALQYIPTGMGAIIAASTPIWMTLFGWMFLQQTRITFMLIAGILVGLLGITGIFYDYISELLKPEFRFGILLGLISTMSWSLGSVLTVRKHLHTHIMYGSGVQLLAAGISLLIASAFFRDQVLFQPLNISFWFSLSYLVVIGSIVTFTAYVYAMQQLPPSTVSVYAYINPIIALIAGALILNEQLTVNTGLFSLVTILGVWMVNREASK